MNRSKNRRSGFTLLEVLLVLIIIGLLVGLVAPQIFGMREQANVDATRSQIALIYNACDYFSIGMHDYPASLNQLVENPGVGSKWAGPYLKDGRIPKDAWKQDFVYEAQPGGTKPLIYSVGRDGQAGTADDVHLEENQ